MNSKTNRLTVGFLCLLSLHNLMITPCLTIQLYINLYITTIFLYITTMFLYHLIIDFYNSIIV